MRTAPPPRRLPPILQWTGPGRLAVFVLSAASIWCLLAEMYGLVSMRLFVLAILIPATVLLYGAALLDRARGDRRLWRAVVIGTLGGLVGALAYDLFRLPFVFSKEWGLDPLVPPMPLFKVFPRFGALILGQPMEQGSYSPGAHVVGWAYHFSNGAAFGVMFAAMIGDPARRCGRAVPWAVLMAADIEACLLVSPYAGFFDIRLSPRFVTVTLAAHLVFGLALGLYYARHARRWTLSGASAVSAP